MIDLTKEYKSRINKTFDYIEKNISKQFSLEELADISNFSKYHFHRIFFGMVGETPFQFINRIRLEKSATILCSNQHQTITEIAFKLGFTDISIFSRNFKAYFGKSASEYRKDKLKNSNLSRNFSN